MLKEYGYIDWKEYGMKSCYFCKTPAEKYVGTAGAVLSGVIIAAIIPIEILRAKLKKRHRELTELAEIESEQDGKCSAGQSTMLRYLQDNHSYSQQHLSVPFTQEHNSYNQQQQSAKSYPQQFQNYTGEDNQQHMSQQSQMQYQQQMPVLYNNSQQNYLIQQQQLLQQQQQQQRMQQQPQNFNYYPTHPDLYL